MLQISMKIAKEIFTVVEAWNDSSPLETISWATK
jgi:hypothetical protein